MVAIGIDPSINSTGACVYRDGEIMQYVIGSKASKVTQRYFLENGLRFIDYGKNTGKVYTYSDKEKQKTENLITLSQYIKFLVYDNSPDIVVMEGVSYGSTSGSSLVDLAGLNFLFRKSVLDHCDNLVIASPMEIKKFATGNGGVDKDVMIHVWREMLHMPDPGNAKVDDVADAYFMALYGVCQIDEDFRHTLMLPKVDSDVLDKNNSQKPVKMVSGLGNVPEDVAEAFSEINIYSI